MVSGTQIRFPENLVNIRIKSSMGRVVVGGGYNVNLEISLS